MFCKECGRPMSEKDLFCKYCGTKSDAVYEKKSKVMPILIGIAAATLVIVIVVALVVIKVLGTKDENTTENNHSNVKIITETENSDKSGVSENTIEQAQEAIMSKDIFEFQKELELINLEGASYGHDRQVGMFVAEALEDTEGIFKTEVVDLDADGTSELLAFEIKQNSDKDGAFSEIHAIVYKESSGEVEAVSDTVVVSHIFEGSDDIMQIRIALMNNHYICIDATANVFLEADGGIIDMSLWEYDGTKFAMRGQIAVAGSDWSDSLEYCPDIKEALKAAGLYKTITQVYKYGIFSFSMADEGMRALCKITAKLDVNDPYGSNAKHVNTVLHYIDGNPENDYLLENSAYAIITDASIISFDKQDLRVARNEIFARYSRKFSDEQLQNYFESKAWYMYPYCEYENPDANILSAIERDNTKVIKKYEE